MYQFLMAIVNDPKSIVTIISLGILCYVLSKHISKIEHENAGMKEKIDNYAESLSAHYEKTSTRFNNHAKEMIDFNKNLSVLKSELFSEIESLRDFASHIAREFKTLDHSLGLESEALEAKLNQVMNVQNDLDHLHGKIDILDASNSEFKISVATNRDALLKLKDVLVIYGEEIHKLKGRKS